MARGEHIFNVAVLSRENVDDRQSLQDNHLEQAGKEQSQDSTSKVNTCSRLLTYNDKGGTGGTSPAVRL
jgi:hypothetical protein